ncbi:MAG: hypothetical protein DME51_08960 [Verrucomicrobia bacterium]|nr:MAG: hypothetical protein DME51_08960 [Verrucomicrobiota bacterium]
MKLALKPENLAQLVFFIRGEKVMLDSDLAMLYGVSTKALNQAFRRNKQRFPSDFALQLSKEEFHHLRSQIVTSSLHGGRRYHPYAFTEQGVAMLSSVLRSSRAELLSLSFAVFLPAIIVVWLMVMSVFAALIGGAMSSLHHP